MVNRESNSDLSGQLEHWVADAIEEALRHEDAAGFLRWVEANFPRYIGAELSAGMNPRLLRLLSINMGRALWNVIPLPSNHFRPKSLPVPGRNDRCYCGSGEKYKHCCSNAPSLDLPDSASLLPIVLRHFDPEKIVDFITAKQIPIAAIIALADSYINDDESQKAVPLLESLLKRTSMQHDDELGHALFLLCNAYDELGDTHKKITLLDQITRSAPASSLRSNAWQRIATIRADQGEWDDAWRAARAAARDDPRDNSIGILEVQLFLAQNRLDAAQERARTWLRHAGQDRTTTDTKAFSFMRQIAEDPELFASEFDEADSEDDELCNELWDWTDTVEERPLPRYEVVNEADLATRDRSFSDPTQAHQWDQIGQPMFTLQPPASIRRLESLWREVFPVTKPFSVQDDCPRDLDPWNQDIYRKWIAFLESHPEAYDSVEILDDLASAVMELEDEYDLLYTLLERSHAIVQRAVQRQPDITLPWVNPANRSALRTIARLTTETIECGDGDSAETYAKELLALNPSDNHGLRYWLVNKYVADEAAAEALDLVGTYADDDHPALRYGKALALLQTHQIEAADEALKTAVHCRPQTARYLLATHIRQPTLSPHGTTVAGEDEAWYYREDMRPIWEETPGAMDRLRVAAAQCAPISKQA